MCFQFVGVLGAGRLGWPLLDEARAEAKALSDFVVSEFEVQLGASLWHLAWLSRVWLVVGVPGPDPAACQHHSGCKGVVILAKVGGVASSPGLVFA